MSNFAITRQSITSIVDNDPFVRSPLRTEGVLRGAYNVARGLAGVQDTQHGGSVGHALGGWVRKKLNIGGAGDDAEKARLQKIDPRAAKDYGKLRGSQEREKLHAKMGGVADPQATTRLATAAQVRHQGHAEKVFNKAAKSYVSNPNTGAASTPAGSTPAPAPKPPAPAPAPAAKPPTPPAPAAAPNPSSGKVISGAKVSQGKKAARKAVGARRAAGYGHGVLVPPGGLD